MFISLVFILLRVMFLVAMVGPVIYAGYQFRSLNITFFFALLFTLSLMLFARRRPKTHDPQAILLPLWMKFVWQLFFALVLSFGLFFVGALTAKFIGGADMRLGFTKMAAADYLLLGLFSVILIAVPLLGMFIAKLVRYAGPRNNKI